MASSRFDGVRWQARLAELVVFVDEYQRWPKQNAVALVERRVAFWVSAQRKAYRRGAMPAGRIVRLESVPGWSWRHERPTLTRPVSARATVDAKWRAHLDALRAFRAGQQRWPSLTAADSVERLLAAWAGRQTRTYRVGKLRADRVNALEAVQGWMWSTGPTETLANRQRFEQKLAQVAAFVSANGWYPRRTTRNVDETRLGQWCQAQRRKHASGDLTADRTAAIEVLPGWEWQPDPAAAVWRQQHTQITAWLATHGPNPDIQSVDPHERRASRWLRQQQATHQTGGLTDEQVALLGDHLA